MTGRSTNQCDLGTIYRKRETHPTTENVFITLMTIVIRILANPGVLAELAPEDQWRNHEPWLGPLQDSLGDALVRYRE